MKREAGLPVAFGQGVKDSLRRSIAQYPHRVLRSDALLAEPQIVNLFWEYCTSRAPTNRCHSGQ